MGPTRPQRPHHAEGADEAPTEVVTVPVPTVAPESEGRPMTLAQRLGWPWGVVGTGVPQFVFAAAIVYFPLLTAAGISLAVAVVMGVVLKVCGQPTSTALGGVLGVGVASGISVWTGSATDFFLVGIVAALIGLVATAGSVVVRRPLSGLAWNALHGGGHAWRENRMALRAHDVATLATAAVFAARFVVMQWLYDLDSTGWLAIARVAMGTPMTLVAALVIVWAFRRSTRCLIAPGASLLSADRSSCPAASRRRR